MCKGAAVSVKHQTSTMIQEAISHQTTHRNKQSMQSERWPLGGFGLVAASENAPVPRELKQTVTFIPGLKKPKSTTRSRNMVV